MNDEKAPTLPGRVNAKEYWRTNRKGETNFETVPNGQMRYSDMLNQNCGVTKGEALAVRRKKEKYLELVLCIFQFNNGWEPDWADHDQSKFRLVIVHYQDGETGLRVQEDFSEQAVANELYFRSPKFRDIVSVESAVKALS